MKKKLRGACVGSDSARALGWWRWSGLMIAIATTVLITLGCASRAESPARADERVTLQGYRAKQQTPAATVYVFEANAQPRIVMHEPGTFSTIEWHPTDGVATPLKPSRVETRGSIRIAWLPSPFGEAETQGTLRVDDRSFTVEVIAPKSEWILLKRALADSEPERALLALERGARSPIERLTLQLERARLKLRSGDAAAYRRLQMDRAEDAATQGLFTEASDALSAAAYYAYRTRVYEDVESLVASSIALAKRADHRLGEARALLMRGYAEHEFGRYRTAIATLERAAQIAWTIGADADLAWIEKALGGRLQDLGLHRRALEGFERLAGYFEHAPPRARASFLSDRGWVLARAMATGHLEADWARPQKDLEEGLRLARQLEARETEQTLLANLTWLTLAANNLEEAAQWLADLRALPGLNASGADEFGDILQARVDLALGRTGPAAHAAQQAVERALSSFSRWPSETTWRAYFVRGLVRSAQGLTAEARDDYSRAMDTIEALARTTPVTWARASFLDERRELYEHAIQTALQDGDPAAAFEIVERARAQLLWGFMRRAQSERLSTADGREQAVLRETFHEARRQLDALRREAPLIPGQERPAHEARIQALATEVTKHFDALQAWQDRRFDTDSLRVDATQVQRRLGPNAVLLSLYESPSITVAFRVSNGAIEVGPVPKNADDWRAALKDADVLYLCADHERRRHFRQMTESLLDRGAVSLIPSATVLTRPRRPMPRPMVVVADAKSDLSHARREGQHVAARNPTARLFSGDRALRTDVWSALRNAGRFHFAGHARLQSSNPWDARLELADGVITLEDLLSEPTSVQAAVLNGCRTGTVERQDNAGRIGLPDAFILGGARSVLATFDDVDDKKAAVFVASFVNEGGEQHPLRAFRRAALASMRRDDPTWRSFYVMGHRP